MPQRVDRRFWKTAGPAGAVVLGVHLAAAAALGWSWSGGEQQAPPAALFPPRGEATIEFGQQHAAPGAPADQAHLFGVIRYRDHTESFRDYDVFVSPNLAIWKMLRYELPNASAQYVGGFHYDNCQDGQVHAVDRVFMPAIGLHPQFGNECGAVNTTVRTNYGCRNSHFSQPWPLDNFQGAGSGSGSLPDLVVEPAWTQSTQTLYAVSLSKPWIYYDEIEDPNSPHFQQDFVSCPDRMLIRQKLLEALRNVRLENQLRILPDGTIMWSNLWTDLKGRPWVPYATDGHWLAPDSAPNGRVFYYDPDQGTYVEPFAGGQNPQGMYLTAGSGWVGYFVDPLRPSFGIGFYYDRSQGVSIFPANNWPGSPAVLATNYWTNIVSRGRVFRQNFLVVGTKEEMQARDSILRPYVKMINLPPPTTETFCSDGIDDDGDGLIDCADPDCFSASVCLPDFDGDGDIDQSDFGFLQACFTEGLPPVIRPGCERANLNGDSRIDQDDFTLFARCHSGANVPISPGCLAE